MNVSFASSHTPNSHSISNLPFPSSDSIHAKLEHFLWLMIRTKNSSLFPNLSCPMVLLNFVNPQELKFFQRTPYQSLMPNFQSISLFLLISLNSWAVWIIKFCFLYQNITNQGKGRRALSPIIDRRSKECQWLPKFKLRQLNRPGVKLWGNQFNRIQILSKYFKWTQKCSNLMEKGPKWIKIHEKMMILIIHEDIYRIYNVFIIFDLLIGISIGF